MESARQAGRSLLRMLADSVTVFVRHWPALITLFLAGAALHGGFLWLAVWISKVAPFVSMLLLPFASLSMLIAMVLMLRAVAPSLPALADSLDEGTGSVRLRADLVLAVQMLIPFLALYAAQGFIRSDLQAFVYSATADEWMNEGFRADWSSRLTFVTEAQALVLVVAALIARKVIAGFGLAKKNLAVAGIGGYLEALWMVTLASYFTASIDRLYQWVVNRAIVVHVLDALETIVNLLGPIGAAIQGVLNQIGSILSSMGSLVIMPVAWLAVGATIYGASLPAAKPLVTSEQMTERLAKVPNPVRRAASQVIEPVVSPVKNTLTAIGRIAVAGVVPMVMICLIFVAASKLRVLTTQVLRDIIGPQSGLMWTAISPYIDLIAVMAYTVTTVALLAAAVNAIVVSQRRAQATPDAGLQP